MASLAKRALETDSDSHETIESKRSCLKPSPASGQLCKGVSGENAPASSEPSPASGEPSPASGEPSPASGEPSPASGEPSPASSEPSPASTCSSEPSPGSDKLIVDLTGDSDEDEEDISIPPTPAVNIDTYYSCSELSNSQLLRHLGMKRFLVDHDYILCPYCIVTDQGRRIKPSETRVSTIIQRYIDEGDEGYMKLVGVMQEMDKVINVDTSECKSVHRLADKIIDKRFELQDKHVRSFIIELQCVLHQLVIKNDKESCYRTLFFHFLQIFASTLPEVRFTQKPSAEKNTISFPNWNNSTTISGKPDIVIAKQEGGIKKTLVMIECKRYREMTFMFENAIVKDDDDVQKILPKVRFCKTVKKSGKSDKSGKKEYIMERMYKDLDPSICRSLKRDDKSFFSSFIGQLVGEVLAWFNTSDQIPVIMPFEIAQDKCMKYIVGQLGFKIIFVTIGINNSCRGNPPHIRIGKRSGMGLDVFITRPFDLMKADDRGKIRDILFVMMASSWRPTVALNG